MGSEMCIRDRIYGDPSSPSTTIVFGEKGSGKTAMRLMIQSRIDEYNADRKEGRVFLVCYDDLNQTLDRLAGVMRTKDRSKALQSLCLSDHQDAILAQAVTDLLDSVLNSKDRSELKKRRKALKRMSLQKRMDFATLALLYDQPRSGESSERWRQLKRILKVGTSWNRGAHSAMSITLGLVAVVGFVGWYFFDSQAWEFIVAVLFGSLGFLGSGFWWLARSWRYGRLARRLAKEVRIGQYPRDSMSRKLWDLNEERMAGQPLPEKGDQDIRYDLTNRFVHVLKEIGFSSLVVLVDRIDEPMMVNGEPERMKLVLWPMMNNKFLQQQDIGIKMLLPVEMSQLLAGESSEFRRQARLDKQNVVNPLRWTGITLYDLCSSRFRNCRIEGAETCALEDLFTDEVTRDDLVEALDQMHQPRDAFKFLYAIIADFCNNTSAEGTDFRIPKATLDFVRRTQSDRLVELYRGAGTA